MSEIKIITIDGNHREAAEKELADLIDAGWHIVAAGGGPLMIPRPIEDYVDETPEGRTHRVKYQSYMTGFVILQKDS